MRRTVFHILKMDCPSEESLIRSRLEEIETIQGLEFDIPTRKLFVYHTAAYTQIESAIAGLSLDSRLISSEKVKNVAACKQVIQRKTLWAVLIINFSFFIIEMLTGLISGSMGLVADSLDMLADSFVYSFSLIAVGGTLARKKKIARLAGYFQILLALIGLIEVIRRFAGLESLPDFTMMIYISAFALVGNSICLYLLQKSRSDEAHMQASMIFTSNDVIINLGVITAGLLVLWLESSIPDLAIGAIVFLVVTRGAFRILKLGT